MAHRTAGPWAMAYGVVPESMRSLAGRLRNVGRLPCDVVVGAKGDHWSRTAQMRTDDLHCGITLQMAGSDQLHGGDGVLERCAHHPRDAVFADQRRACPVVSWMHIHDRAAPGEFGEDRLEFGIGDRAIEDAGVHRHADMPNSS